MKFLLTLDVGTTAVKAALFDTRLNMLGVVIREYELLTPEKDLVELPAPVYWDNAVAAIQSLIADTRVQPEDIASITCTTQGETLIPIDKNGAALHHAIVWLDSRAKRESEQIAALFPKEEFYRKTGIAEVSPYCPVAKLLWLKNNLPAVYENTHRFLLLEDYLIFCLTGKAVTNPALCCTTGYFDISSNSFWAEMLDAFQLDAAKLPSVLPSGVQAGTLTPAAARQLGLPETLAVTTGAMDQVTAAIGAGNIEIGVVSETTGTCLGVLACAGASCLDAWSPISVYSHAIEGLYLKVVITQTAGMILKWFRTEFCPDFMVQGGDPYEHMSALAAAEPVLSRGVFLYPYLTGLESNPKARGAFLGVGLDTGRGCFIRAVMESVGYTLCESIDNMGLTPQCIHALGGGSKSEVWNQIKADICGTVIKVMQTEEASALGAAVLGGVAVGLFPSIQSACSLLTPKKEYRPIAENTALYTNAYQKFLSLYSTLAPLFKG